MIDSSQLALDNILQKPTKGIPIFWCNVMEHDHIDRIAGVPPGTYRERPEETYIAMQKAIGVCLLDQYIWNNPLTMASKGYEDTAHGATTGAREIAIDGITIDSPEAVVEHMERFVFPRLIEQAASFDENACARQIIESENSMQEMLAPEILKSPYGHATFPMLHYGTYGYVNYFSAYALYPEVMEKHFALQADFAVLKNRAVAKAVVQGQLPPLYRSDHDMADSRGTLVNIKSLDEIWLPHFARSMEPMLKAGIKLIWHCDGNLMEMVPRLLDCGFAGFQGLQYEAGMDYEKICRMKTRDGEDLIMLAGVSVTSTLPLGRPADVKKQMEWLVEHGPRTGLFLTASSSVTPGVPWENMKTFWDGLLYYREHGRG